MEKIIIQATNSKRLTQNQSDKLRRIFHDIEKGERVQFPPAVDLYDSEPTYRSYTRMVIEGMQLIMEKAGSRLSRDALIKTLLNYSRQEKRMPGWIEWKRRNYISPDIDPDYDFLGLDLGKKLTERFNKGEQP